MSDAGIREYRIASHAFAVRIDDDTLIWNPSAEQLHRLNPTATLVWEALREWATPDTLTHSVRRSGHVDARHVRQCVEELYEAGIVERRIRRTN
jgi:hypothetical protein